jgi:hypothetical protein
MPSVKRQDVVLMLGASPYALSLHPESFLSY